jgi:hypothetical protein
VNALRITFASALLLGSPATLAQSTARPDPADPRLTVPAPATGSAYAGYRGFRDEPLADWRAVNDEMRRLGGPAGHMRDAAKAPDRDGTPPAAATPATGGPKHGH